MESEDLDSLSDNQFNPNYGTITFKVKYETVLGQEVRLVGNIEELGSWDPKKSILMTTNNDIYPYWISTQEITGPIGMGILYKYLIYDNHLKKFIWENEDQNRFFEIEHPGKFEIGEEKGKKIRTIKKIENHEDISHISFVNADDNSEDLYIQKYPLLNREIFDLLEYDSIKLESNQICKNDLMNLTLKITNDDRLIIVSSLLPFDVEFNDNNEIILNYIPDNDIYSVIYGIKEKNLCNIYWVGMLRNYKKFNEEQLNNISNFLLKSNIYLIIPDKNDYRDYWIYTNFLLKNIFVNNTINVKEEYFLNSEKYFTVYKKINQLFALTIYKKMQKNDLIMINDIGCMLIPNYLCQKNNNAKIGIFFHTVFPSSDVLKFIPYHIEILKSVLLCDVIGFHVFQNARQFLTSIQRTLGLFYEVKIHGLIVINYLGRIINIKVMNAGIDFESIDLLLNQNKNDFEIIKKNISDSYHLNENKFIFLSIDNLNFSSELIIKFDAFLTFKEKNENKIKKELILIQIIRCNIEDDNEEIINEKKKQYEHIKEKINEINKKFNKEIIFLIKKEKVNLLEKYAFYSLSDCLFYLQNGEGYCLSIQEYIIIKSYFNNLSYNLILNENQGLNSSIKGINKVNIYDINSIINGLENVIYNKIEINNEIISQNINYIKKNNILNWSKSFFFDLKKASDTYNDTSIKIGMSLGLNFFLMKLNSKFSHLNKNELIEAYRNSNKCLMFLNYEGTLELIDENEEKKDKEFFKPSEQILSLLTLLTSNPKNKIYLVSGREKTYLEKWFENIPKLGIAAEYGFFYNLPGKNKKEEEFNELIKVSDWSWKKSVYSILKGFTDKTEGSYIIQKETMLSWVYKDCDQYFGHLQALEIITHLENIFETDSLIVSHGKDYIDIKLKNVNKGYFISNIIKQEFLNGEEPDMIISIGDEESDEVMFKYLNYIQYNLRNDDIKIFTCTIQRKPSEAKFFLNEPNEVIDYLESLNQVGNCENSVNYSKRNSDIQSFFLNSQNGNNENQDILFIHSNTKSNRSDTYSGGIQSLNY